MSSRYILFTLLKHICTGKNNIQCEADANLLSVPSKSCSSSVPKIYYKKKYIPYIVSSFPFFFNISVSF